MLRQNRRQKDWGQVFIEYTMVIGAIIMVLMAMSVMIKRGLQGMIKITADQVGNQENADQRFDEDGHTVASYTSTRTSSDTVTSEFLGVKGYTYADVTETNSTMSSNLGFTETEGE